MFSQRRYQKTLNARSENKTDRCGGVVGDDRRSETIPKANTEDDDDDDDDDDENEDEEEEDAGNDEEKSDLRGGVYGNRRGCGGGCCLFVGLIYTLDRFGLGMPDVCGLYCSTLNCLC